MTDKTIIDKIETEDNESDVNDVQHPLGFIDGFVPDKNNIAEKGHLSAVQTVLFSQVLEVYRPYEDYLSDETIEMINNFVKKVEKRQISVNGKSREEITRILEGLFNSYQMEETDENKNSIVSNLLKVDKGGD